MLDCEYIGKRNSLEHSYKVSAVPSLVRRIGNGNVESRGAETHCKTDRVSAMHRDSARRATPPAASAEVTET